MGHLGHLHCTVPLEVTHAAQAAVVENPGADSAWEEALGGPDLTDVTHLIVDNLAGTRRVCKYRSRDSTAAAWHGLPITHGSLGHRAGVSVLPGGQALGSCVGLRY